MQVSEYDWSMEGLKQFAGDHIAAIQRDPKKVFTLDDVAAWSESREEYMDNQTLTNARRLSRYIKSHKYMVESVAGFQEMPAKYGNRIAYRLTPVK